MLVRLFELMWGPKKGGAGDLGKLDLGLSSPTTRHVGEQTIVTLAEVHAV